MKLKSAHWLLAPFLLYLVLQIHGATLGLTDDEAYYWVLAQHPALGYAFHPPAVAWAIWLPQKLLGWLFGSATPGLVRFPAAAFSAAIFGLGIYWLKLAGISETNLKRGALVLLSFAGMYGASWMMVPDLPLFFGWMLLFVSTWKFCRNQDESFTGLGMFFGAAILLLSKYSGVLALGSAGLAVLFLAPREKRIRGVVILIAGAVAAMVPVLIWNAQHDWASLLYQIRDRHGDAHFSGIRWLRFWAIQAILAGPVLFYSFGLLRRPKEFRSTYILLWMLPALLVFGLQPAWSDFKPHWALVIWIPVFLDLAFRFAQGEKVRWARAQMAMGLPLVVIGLLICHTPVLSYFSQMAGKTDPRIDVTNDMFGWDRLREYVHSVQAKDQLHGIPVVGSRYQTSSQAAFALGSEPGRVSFIPRDLKQMDEWPHLQISDGEGPVWPKLTSRVLFVADNRYDAGPEFRDARCTKVTTLETQRESIFGKFVAKRLTVWDCEPLRPLI